MDKNNESKKQPNEKNDKMVEDRNSKYKIPENVESFIYKITICFRILIKNFLNSSMFFFVIIIPN